MRRNGTGIARVMAAVALLLGAAMVLSGCTPLSGLIDQLRPERTAPEPAVIDGDDFTAQQPDWRSCGGGMECAEVFAPLDWDDPSGERITLSLVKQSALSGTAMGTIFVNPGGPGASGVDYISESIDYAVGEALQRSYDIIGWDPRGVGGSSAVSCLDAAGMDEFLFGLGATDTLEPGSDEWIAAAAKETAGFGKACLDATGDLLAHVDTASTVRDLDMLRAVVGDEKLNYLGYSYGTYIGARYADAFPERVGRLVLDGAMDPGVSEAEVVREQTRGFEAALRAYVTDCLGSGDCPVTGTVDQAMAQWGALLDRLDDRPIPASDGRMLSSGTMLTAIITPLYSQSNWSYLDDLFVTVSGGDADLAFFLADFYYSRSGGVYEDNSTEAFMAINCLDYPSAAVLDAEAMRADAAELAQIAPTIGRFQGFGDVFCANWPVRGAESREPVTAAGADPILVIGTTGDPATPYRWAVSLAEQLQSGVLVTFEGEGHTAYGQSSCVNAVVESYFLTGAVPGTDPRCTS